MGFEEIKQSKEVNFQNWIKEFNGEFWLVPKAMPEGAYKAVQMFEHLLDHGYSVESAEVKQASEDFKRITGYEMTDFLDYKNQQTINLSNKN